MNGNNKPKELTGKWVAQQRRELSYIDGRGSTARLYNFQIKMLILLAKNEVDSGEYSTEIKAEVESLERNMIWGMFDE